MIDPHFRTYDGTKYSYHGECDLVMARSDSFDNGLGLYVHARTEIIAGWSRISNLAVQIGDDIFELTSDGSYYFNGEQNVAFPLSLVDGKYNIATSTITHTTKNESDGSIKEDEKVTYTIDLGDDELIEISSFLGMISVRVDAALAGTEGMLGVNGKVGMIGRDGMELTDANEMGSQWQVRDNESMLFHEVRGPQYPESCTLPSESSRRLAISGAVLKQARDACSSIDEDFVDFCIEDVLRTGDVAVAHGYGTAF